MDEMLGNQYFLARQYDKAAEALKRVIQRNPDNKFALRKIIICYTQIGEVDKAFDAFLSLIKKDVDFIINTDPISDDCPCPELVYTHDKEWNEDASSVDSLIVAGILWLYCDLNRSIHYFEQALRLSPDDGRIKAALSILINRKNNFSQISLKKGGGND